MQLNFEEIKKIIPQRFPFIMIDRIPELVPGDHAVAVKNISGNDMVFLGHFPDKAILPGVLIIESMAQTAIILSAFYGDEQDTGRKKSYYLGSVKARFFHPVVPGDQMKIIVKTVKSLQNCAYVSGEAYVDDAKIAEADLVFSAKDE